MSNFIGPHQRHGHQMCHHCVHYCSICGIRYCCKCGEQSYAGNYWPTNPVYPTWPPTWITCGDTSTISTYTVSAGQESVGCGGVHFHSLGTE